MATSRSKTAGTNPEQTRLDEHTDAPSTTAPGDGPADTTDPTERASTVEPDKTTAAAAGHLTVNAAVPVDPDRQLAGVAISKATGGEDDDREDRIEEYDATRPDGSTVRVRHNLETGDTELV
ncbi:hypothetical protein [Actinoplanes rectilineatus]|uniref:hypothetical protein n=1 Tax=Actinoplanes rectilineatus TaxID=113571 RepID=UPI0005F2796B|nr:hypothetical protein [Actinoplanes rectilineatus]